MDSNKIETEVTSKPELSAEQVAERSASRRRLLKAGMTVAPVALTLTSRPVLAWHCKSPSAWGSQQLNPKSSLQVGKIGLPDETWKISNWVDNTTRAGLPAPWLALKQNIGFTGTPDALRNSYTIGALYSNLNIPTGLNSTDLVKKVLKNGSNLQKYLVTARLNFKLIANVKTCLTSSQGVDELNFMSTGGYQPLPSVTCHSGEIINYLGSNWIVQP